MAASSAFIVSIASSRSIISVKFLYNFQSNRKKNCERKVNEITIRELIFFAKTTKSSSIIPYNQHRRQPVKNDKLHGFVFRSIFR